MGRDAADLLTSNLVAAAPLRASRHSAGARPEKNFGIYRLFLGCLLSAVFQCVPASGGRVPKSQIARRVARAGISLDATRKVDAGTQHLGANACAGFMCWLADCGIRAPLWQLASCPQLLDRLAVAYGQLLFDECEALYVFRHLLTAFQRRHAEVRRRIPRSWDVVTNWEEIEPVVHRKPIPLLLLRALVAVALCQGQWRLAVVLLSVYFGITRANEVTEATRDRFLLPLQVGSGLREIIIHHPAPKTRRRGARTQYSTIEDEQAVNVVERLLHPLAAKEPIYAGGARAFKKAFDSLLAQLSVQPGIYSPACMRGGGACAFDKATRDISTLAWRMRIQNQQTLTHYLQEVAYANSLAELSSAARAQISTAARVYDAVVSSVVS